jgi:hypothetical protein
MCVMRLTTYRLYDDNNVDNAYDSYDDDDDDEYL